MELLELLKSRYSASKAWTKPYIDEVKICLEDYNCEKKKSQKAYKYDQHLSQKRYELPIPYIYSTHESILASLFEKPLDLIYTGKGAEDEDKSNLVKAVYKYLYDKLDLEEFLNNTAWWFVLTGFVSSYQTYDIRIKGYKPVMDSQGQPMIDEITGEPVTTPEYEWHDPVTFVDDPTKTYFSPDSEFTVKGNKIPYIVREKLVDVEELRKTYNVPAKYDIPATEKLEVEGYKPINTDSEDDIKRAKCMYYCGTIPEENKKDVENWESGKRYYFAFIDTRILHTAEDDKDTSVTKWFGSPIDFFGFGIGKTLRTMQKEMSTRRGQQVRYADLHAYPWLTLDASTKIDQVQIQDLLKRKPLTYSGNPPAYLIPPKMPDVVTQTEQTARSDAQFISGTLDLSKGAQETNTVKTATGQQLFAQSQDKRTQKARKTIGKYFKNVVINLMKQARDNWEEEKIITITDEDGQEIEMVVNRNQLEDIDFDTDIDIQLDTVTVNKDALSERVISLYDKVKDDPLVDRKKVFLKMLKEGFNIKNPDLYIIPEGSEGTQPSGNEIKQPSQAQETPQPESPSLAPDLLGNQEAPKPNYGH